MTQRGPDQVGAVDKNITQSKSIVTFGCGPTVPKDGCNGVGDVVSVKKKSKGEDSDSLPGHEVIFSEPEEQKKQNGLDN